MFPREIGYFALCARPDALDADTMTVHGIPRFWRLMTLVLIVTTATVSDQVTPEIEVISAWPSANLYYQESLTLTCHGGGNPAPTYTWTRDSGSLPARAVVDGSEGTLTLVDVTDADSGVYTCTADNGFGTATMNITVVGCPDTPTPIVLVGLHVESVTTTQAICFPTVHSAVAFVFQKYLHAYGIPILGSSILPDDALRRACYDVLFMLADRKDIRDSYYNYYGRAAIMAETEVTLDIPEHSGLDPSFNTRARGLGGTVSKPVSTGAEENVLCYNIDSSTRVRGRGDSVGRLTPEIEVISAWPSANLYYQESLTLTCHGGGNPAPTYTWTRDSGSLPARAVVDGSEGTLTLVDVTDADSGVYTCTADNGFGTATMNITVVGCPDTPTPIVLVGLHVESVTTTQAICFPTVHSAVAFVFQKYLHAYGIPILGSSILPDDALRRACYDVLFMLADRKDIRDSYYNYYGRAAIMAETEVTLDIPEHSGLDPSFNTRARGLGGTVSKPVSTGAEENVLCYNIDSYKVEDMFFFAFAQGLDILGARKVISDFLTRLQAAYDSALANGLWANTYADDSRDGYWAEGVQSFFNVNHERDPSDGIHNHVNTRAELRTYDPDLYNIIKLSFTI
ncbi:CHL1 [Branchiostoma lanceolatum]|uniref:CHL1 protein n=1 Tax=Branchiostoma lanceolatum TaxID=7740 RepID=A0A8K0A2S4_BRALA|nr:CHL1 [Branchiostoma lanceolatum]